MVIILANDTTSKNSSNDKSLSSVMHNVAPFSSSLMSGVQAGTPVSSSVSTSFSDDAIVQDQFVCQNDSTSIWLNAGVNLGSIDNANLIDIRNCYFNVHSLKNKLYCLHNLSKEFEYISFDFICVSETWLNDHISSSRLTNGVKYNVFRQDIFDKNGGDAALLLKSTNKVLLMALPGVYSCAQIVAANIICYNTKHRLSSVYKPLNSAEFYLSYFVLAWYLFAQSLFRVP